MMKRNYISPSGAGALPAVFAGMLQGTVLLSLHSPTLLSFGRKFGA